MNKLYYKLFFNKMTQENLKPIIEKIFNWNNKNLILWNENPYQIYITFDLLKPFADMRYMHKLNYKFVYFNSDRDYINFINEPKNKNYNIFYSTLYLQDIPENYLIIKEETLNEYTGKYKNINNSTLIFELHLNPETINTLSIYNFTKNVELFLKDKGA